jgi:hypothetical protein
VINLQFLLQHTKETSSYNKFPQGFIVPAFETNGKEKQAGIILGMHDLVCETFENFIEVNYT